MVVPRSLQTRLTLAFVGVVTLTLALVAPIVINRIDDYFRTQETESLRARREALATVLLVLIGVQANQTSGLPVLLGDELNPRVDDLLRSADFQAALARVAQADVRIAVGRSVPGVDGTADTAPVTGGRYVIELGGPPAPGQARDPAIVLPAEDYPSGSDGIGWSLELELANPYTSRASTIGAITALIVVVAGIAVLIAVAVAAMLSQRFTTPLRRLTEASRRIAEGDLSSRLVADDTAWTTTELTELGAQFNAMADRLEESVEFIRRDRDRSRDFLADVSHELRTPIAAIRTFTELLRTGAGEDPATRAEFLESSAVQLERLDWLATNLLELSKLDSGLVLLDLRPDDLRSAIESSVEQAEPAAARRGVTLHLDLPDAPVRLRHDPPRVGQIVTNLVGNAVKFTPRGGRVDVRAAATPDGGARIEVRDTGVGIDAAELPRIFERFYRGSRANEARGSGSGLGLAIVKSIVDMHHGTIEVESAPNAGSRFVVTLPRDPRELGPVGSGAAGAGAVPATGAASGSAPGAAAAGKMADSSPAPVSGLNPGTPP